MVFAHVLGWPENGLVQLGSVTANPSIKVILTLKVDNNSYNDPKIGLKFQVVISLKLVQYIQVSLLGFEGLVEWSEGSGLVAIEVHLPDR